LDRDHQVYPAALKRFVSGSPVIIIIKTRQKLFINYSTTVLIANTSHIR